MNRLIPSILCIAACAASALAAETEDESLPSVAALLAGSNGDEEMFANWPPVGEVVKRAIENLPQVLRSPHLWASRQKTAALLPTLRLQSAVDEGAYDVTDINRDRFNRNRVSSYRLTDQFHDFDSESITVTWDLSRFIFDRDEVSGADAERLIEQLRMEVRREMVQAYYGLREARKRLAQGVFKEKTDRIEVETLADSYQALLDLHTRGYFSDFIQQGGVEKSRIPSAP